MPRPVLLRSLLLACAVAGLAAPPAGASSPGPAPAALRVWGTDAAGPTTATVSVLATWSGPPRAVTVRYGQNGAWDHRSAAALVSGAGFAAFRLTGLEPGSVYQYGFDDGTTISDTGSLRTTAPGTPANLEPPAIVDAGGGEYRCDPGRWDDPAATLAIAPPSLGSFGSVALPARCIATATNDAGTSTAASEGSVDVGPPGSASLAWAPPRFFSPPTVAVDGQRLTCSPGAYTTGGGVVRTAYRWLRDDTPAGAGAGYALVPDDGGHTLTCQVTLSNAAGQSAASSRGVPVTPGAAPADAPDATATPAVLTVQRGASTSAPPTSALGRLLAQADRLTASGRQPWSFLAPGPGRVLVVVTRAGRTLARGSAVATRAGLFAVTTRPTSRGRRGLHDVHRRVVVEVAFTPAGASRPYVRRRSVRL